MPCCPRAPSPSLSHHAGEHRGASPIGARAWEEPPLDGASEGLQPGDKIWSQIISRRSHLNNGFEVIQAITGVIAATGEHHSIDSAGNTRGGQGVERVRQLDFTTRAGL